MTPAKRLLKWVDRFTDTPVMVIGDLMVDKSIRGSVDRISPEAPVPVIDIKQRTSTPGGAGNVVCNLISLGARATIISVRGSDSDGEWITSDMSKRGVNTSGVLIDNERPTITKTRVLAGNQQVVRLDEERRSPLGSGVLARVIAKIKSSIPHHKGVILSDYGKGVITPPVIRAAIAAAHKNQAVITVDPKIEHFFQYKGVDCLTPNTKESIEGMRALAPKTDEDLFNLGWKIMKKLRSRSLLITRGEKGMTLFESGKKPQNIATHAREVFDVTGAGDTVITTFTLAMAVGAPLYEAALIANMAASIVVGKVGTATASRAELIKVIKEI